MFGDGEQTRDYVYVGDVADAFAAAADGAGTGPYNVGTGIETSVLELGRAIADAGGTTFDPEFAPPRLGEVQADRDRPLAGGGGARLARGDVARPRGSSRTLAAVPAAA